MNKIYILGTVGCGKSTLAKKISNILKIPHYDLDDIFFTKKFNIKRNEKDRIKLLSKLCKKKKWIIEGVFSKPWVEQGIKKCDIVIFLDIPLRTLIYRITKRTIQREKSKLKGKERYNENFKEYVNLIKAVINYKKKKGYRGYIKHQAMIKKHKVNVVYLKNKKEINKFLGDLKEK